MRRLLAILVVAAVGPAAAHAQIKEALIVFKDGFSIKGKVIQKKDFIYDPETGASFPIPKDGSLVHIDDDVRRIYFSPYQVQEVIPSKPGETRKDLMQIVKQKPTLRKNHILAGWTFEKFSPWNDRWERTITVNTGRGTLEMRQRIILLTPWQTHVTNMEYDYDQQFLTKEMGAEFIMELLNKHYGAQKEMKEADKRLKIAQFIYQVGWYGIALSELEKLVKEYPETKDKAEPLIKQLKEMRTSKFVEDIEQAHRVGQHEQAIERIATYFKDKINEGATEKQQIVVQDLKAKYESAREKTQQARQYLKELTAKLAAANRPFWGVAAASIDEELSFDTLPRLETFVPFAQQHLRELADNAKPAQTTEEVLAIAVSGWLQGNTQAEPDVKNATKLFNARLMLQEYLKTDGSVARAQLASKFSQANDLPVDMMARLIRQLPPITPYDKIASDQLKLEIEAPDAAGGSYLVQLPPDYNHQRSYPVLVLLQSAREPAKTLIERWKEAAAHHGYILAAPLWGGKGKQFSYNYSPGEHALVLDTLRDLRRRFNVDSDRVFLFGWEAGGTMAFDIGLSHPHEFAGVLPMNGSCGKYATQYWSNGQYLPFYVVEGENDGGNATAARALFKNWTRGNYPSLYVEYKGRASEWYGWELPAMFEWMNKKKRNQPARELGRFHTAGGSGEEFKTLRRTDNRFYWLGASSGSFDEKLLADPTEFPKYPRPVTLQASISVGNESGGKAAKIWNQVNVRVKGVKQVSIWLAPNMIDFTKPVTIRVNSEAHGKSEIIAPSLPLLLEEYFQSGDKQRLYYAKIDVKL